MKHFAIVVSALLMTGCAVKTNNVTETNQESVETAIIKTTEVTEASVCRFDDSNLLQWNKDNRGDKKMERTLFPDASDDLMNEMGFADGVPSSISIFYLRNDDGNVILFDTGLGKDHGGMATSANGVKQGNVQAIVLTHFHMDHIGGMVESGGKAFPNAKVYVCKQEYDYWMNEANDEESKFQRDVMTKYKDNLVIFNWGDELPCGVKAIEAPGHTPGHTVFRKGNVMIVGDLMHGYALQKVHPEISCEYDQDKTLAAETRVKILKYIKENNLVMVGMHQPVPEVLVDNNVQMNK